MPHKTAHYGKSRNDPSTNFCNEKDKVQEKLTKRREAMKRLHKVLYNRRITPTNNDVTHSVKQKQKISVVENPSKKSSTKLSLAPQVSKPPSTTPTLQVKDVGPMLENKVDKIPRQQKIVSTMEWVKDKGWVSSNEKVVVPKEHSWVEDKTDSYIVHSDREIETESVNRERNKSTWIKGIGWTKVKEVDLVKYIYDHIIKECDKVESITSEEKLSEEKPVESIVPPSKMIYEPLGPVSPKGTIKSLIRIRDILLVTSGTEYYRKNKTKNVLSKVIKKTEQPIDTNIHTSYPITDKIVGRHL